MLTWVQKERLKTAKRNYEEGLRRVYGGAGLESTIKACVARYSVALELQMEKANEGLIEKKG
jgi:hypothetical protein